jgi:hypothetical protein
VSRDVPLVGGEVNDFEGVPNDADGHLLLHSGSERAFRDL